MVFRYRSRLVISVQRYELVRKNQRKIVIFFDFSKMNLPPEFFVLPPEISLHRNLFEGLLQQLPEGSYGGPEGALGSGVRRLHRRTEADNIQVRILA